METLRNFQIRCTIKQYTESSTLELASYFETHGQILQSTLAVTNALQVTSDILIPETASQPYPLASPPLEPQQRPDLPDLGLLSHELLHQIEALLIVHDDDLDAPLLQIGLAAQPALVLADHDARDTKEEASAGA